MYIQNTSTSVDLYADDTTFYCSNLDKFVLERNLQAALDCLQRWCRENGIVLNIDKTKFMLITSWQKRTVLNDAVLNLQYNDMDISMTICDKILGIHVDDNVTWNFHFDFLSKMLSSYMWLLSKIRTYLSTEHRVLFYNAYMKPHLDYCSLIRSNTSNMSISKVSGLQRRSCRLLLGIENNGLIEAFQRMNILSFAQASPRLL